MYYCTHCGNQNADDAVFCNRCGARLRQPAQNTAYSAPVNQPAQNPAYGAPVRTAPVSPLDAPSGGYAALGFFFPVVGLILYCVWRDNFPLRAKSAGKGALAGVITWVGLIVLIYIAYFIFLFSLFR